MVLSGCLMEMIMFCTSFDSFSLSYVQKEAKTERVFFSLAAKLIELLSQTFEDVQGKKKKKGVGR